jgi:PAS domain S-box-containing protein
VTSATPEQFGIGYLFWKVADAVVVASTETGHVLLWNPAAERLFGYSDTEAVGHCIEELIVPPGVRDAHLSGLEQYRRTGHGAIVDRGAPVEVVAMTRDGDEIPVELTLARLDSAADGTGRVLALIRDARPRKEAEAQRTAALREQAAAEAAVRARDEALGAISHDLRAPLTTLRGTIQLLRRRLARGHTLDRAEIEAQLRRMEAATERMGGMVEELLDAARLDAGQALELRRAPTDLVALIERVIEEQRTATPEHAIALSADEPSLVGDWDAARLRRVFENVLANAVKFSPADALVDVGLAREELPDGAVAVLTVRDRGIGVPSRDLPRLFERGYRAENAAGKAPGHGLGLWGSRRIVEQHGGNIAIESREGAGTRVAIRLPVGPARPP